MHNTAALRYAPECFVQCSDFNRISKSRPRAMRDDVFDIAYVNPGASIRPLQATPSARQPPVR